MARNALIALLLLTTQASAECLTKHEARERWPRRHLYWHTSDHCWDAFAGSRRSYRGEDRRKSSSGALADATQTLAPPAPTLPIPLPRPAPKRFWKEPDLTECCWPPLKDLLPGISAHSKGEPK